MTRTFVAVVWVASALVLLACCASPASSAREVNSQRSHLLLNGELTDVLLTKDSEQVTLTIAAKGKDGLRPDWSGVKASVYCFPGREDLGGFRFDMALVSTNTRSGRRASAVFVFKREPSVMDKISQVLVSAYPNACSFTLPLSREEVLARFRARASAEEVRQFEELRLSKDPLRRERALEIVLFKLTGGEWERIGIRVALTQPYFAHEQWYVASALADEKTSYAVGEVLGRAQVGFSGVGNCGCMNWGVPKEQFFRARRALLAAKDPRVRACAARPPEFSFE